MLPRIYFRIYMAGYGGWVIPRFIRRMFARSEAHRAWLSGFTGCFNQADVRFGPANPYRSTLTAEPDHD